MAPNNTAEYQGVLTVMARITAPGEVTMDVLLQGISELLPKLKTLDGGKVQTRYTNIRGCIEGCIGVA
jgi:hypothetical protein